MNTSRSYFTVVVDDLRLGLDVRDVLEVAQPRETVRVPLAPSEVTGLLNFRGQIATVIDLRRRLGLSMRPNDARTMLVMVRVSGGALGLVVDEWGEVIAFDESELEQTPASLSDVISRHTSGLYRTAERPLLVLDLAKVAERQESIDERWIMVDDRRRGQPQAASEVGP
jgi:purine-binding chemotaxis protein CheW